MLSNYAFIDGNNLHLGIRRMGWELDYRRFRVWLREKCAVERAFLFVGYLPQNNALYENLIRYGFELIFKPIIPDGHGRVKGNVDAELVLHTMIEYSNYDRAVLVTSDGDFACLVEYLQKQNKLKIVMSSHRDTCSSLLKQAARGRIDFMNTLRGKLAYTKKSGGVPPRDATAGK